MWQIVATHKKSFVKEGKLSKMDDNYLKKSTLGGLIWKFLENFGTQFINFFIQIVLARLLMPNDYGVIALTAVFIIVANVFVQAGFSSALIQKKSVSDVEYSSAFFAGIFVSMILYYLLFIGAPHISTFYSEPILKWVLRISSLTIVFAGLTSIQNAILIRNLQFQKIFNYRLLGILLQGITGISLAVLGYGVWSLVIANIVNSVVIAVSLWFVVEWKPQLSFSYSKIKDLFSFSSRILLISLLNTLYNNIQSLIIGKSFDPSTLGYYNRGMQIPTLIMINTDGAINEVMFPVLSKCQTDRGKLVSVFRRSLKTSCFIIFPMMVGLATTAEPLTILLLTEKWLPSVPFMIIASLTCMTWPFSIKYQAFNAIGRSDVSLRLNIIGKSIGISLMIFSIRYGVYALVMSFFISSILSVMIGAYITKKFLGYTIMQQINDIFPSLLLSLCMGMAVMVVGNVSDKVLIVLIIQVIVGVVIYAGGAWIFKMDILKYIVKTVIYLVKNDSTPKRSI